MSQLFRWKLISMTGCMPKKNICTMLAIRLRLFPFGVLAGFGSLGGNWVSQQLISLKERMQCTWTEG